MRKLYTSLLLTICALLCFTLQVSAQLNVNTSVTGEDLANSIIGGGVSISNVTLNCGTDGAGIFSNGNTTNVGLNEGVLLTTGNANNAAGNASTQESVITGNGGDPDLAPLVNQPLYDACVLSFDFIPSDNNITVQYVFASEEYPEWVCSEFNDVFGFFVSGPNPDGVDYTGQNVALVPGTNQPVTINNINNNGSFCAPYYPEYYISNATGTTIVYDGFTVVLTAQISVTPGAEYTFKFAIADASDQLYDSGVFIKGNSFSTFFCQAGQVGFNPNVQNQVTFCSSDADQSVQLYNNALSPSEFYEYILADATGTILEISEAGSFDLQGFAEGTYYFYGVSYAGEITGLEVGNHISDIEAVANAGCVDLSPAASAVIELCVDMVCPEDITIACHQSVDPDNTGTPEIIGNASGMYSAEYSDEVSGSCPTTITRTWTLVAAAGVPTVEISCTQVITVVDEEAPVIIGEEEITVECDATDDATFTVEDNCDDSPSVTVAETTEPGDCAGYYTIYRTVTATDNCGNSSTFTQVVNVVDTTAPEFDGNTEDFSVECPEDVPPMEELVATDNCSDNVQTWFFETSLEYGDSTCIITDAVGPGVDWGVVLFNFPGATDYYVFAEPGSMHVYGDGTALLTGTVQAINNPAQQWLVYITLKNKMNWTEWSDLGRYYKDDLLLAGDHYLDWSYYEMDDDNSFLIGAGDFDGSFLYLSHYPVNKLYGFQSGVAANNKNANNGMSGWFNYNGYLNGVAVSGHGDVNIDHECEGNNFETQCIYEIERYWIAVDECGNTNITNQTITVEDTTPPEFTETPEDITIACFDEVPEPDTSLLSAVDNCGGPVEITFAEDIHIGTECSGTITRIYDAIDVCGNLQKFTQIITILDDEAPVLNGVPADLDLSCEEEVPTAANVTATDNCDDLVEVNFNEEITEGNCPQSYTIVRTWSAVDNCGNEVSASQTINISDEMAPVITECPADAHYTCIDDIPAADISLVSATDNCGMVTITHAGDIFDGDECSGTIIRTYLVTDACGNTSECVQVITYNDDIAPVFTNAPEDISVECDNIPDPADVTATDNCSDVTITFEESIFSDGCPGVIQRIWTATDGCGNVAVHEQYITLIDTVAPVLHNLPADESYQCFESVPPALFMTPAGMAASGNNLTFYPGDGITSSAPPLGVYNDAAPGFTSGSFAANGTQKTAIYFTPIELFGEIITISDIASMSYFTKRAIANVNPIYLNWFLEIYTMPDFNDDDNFFYGRRLNLEPYFSAGISAPANTWVQWNTDEGPNQLRVFDPNRGPTIPVYGTFSDPFWSDVTAGPIDWSTYSPAYVSGLYDYTDEKVFYFGISTGTAWADGFEGQVDGVRIELHNGKVATINFEPDPVSPEDVYATDNCDEDVEVAFEETFVAGDCPGSFTIYRTWTATDECNNTTSHTQVITVADTEAPVFSSGDSEITVSCDSEPNIVLPEAVDNCDPDIEVTEEIEIVEGDCAGSWTEIITLTATDNCGNSSSVSITVNYVDDVAPEFTETPGDLYFECIDDVPAVDVSLLVASDNCGEVTITHVGDEQVGDDCSAVINRTYRATDDCGNYSDYVQNIVVNDTTPPVFEFEVMDITVTCDSIPTPGDSYAIDNCTNIIAGYFEVIEEGCPTIITRTWTATDLCGNTAELTQTITVIDEIGPTFISCPENSSYSCLADIPEADLSLVDAIDQCNDVTIVHLGDEIDGDECAGTIYRTYRATDACGNYTDCVQVITYADDEAPVFVNAPEDMIADCSNIPNPAVVMATDNCGEVDVTYSELLFSGGCNGVLQRIWTATDACGNTAVHEQYITLIDTIAPEFAGLPEDAIYECDEEIPTPAQVTATDNCDNLVEIEFSEMIEAGNCPQEYTLFRTWTASDTCNNSVSYTQIIQVIDTTAPVLSGEDYEVTVDCSVDYELPEITATDNCATAVNIEMNTEIIEGNCANEWTAVHTWMASDACGNTAARIITVNYVDDSAPVLVQVPADVAVSCITEVPESDLSLVIGEDECGGVTVTHEGDYQSGDDCNAVIERVYRLTDACGNYVDYTQQIIVIDDIAPVFSSEIEPEITAECDAVPAPAALTATDNCGLVEVVFTETTEDGECAGNYTLYRTWTATDGCGNTSVVTQTVIVSDNTPPVLVNVPEDAEYSCTDEIPAMADVTAWDSCSDVTVTAEEYIEGFTGEDGLRECTLTTPLEVVGAPWALWLPNTIGEPQYYHLTEAGGSFVELSDGRARLTGTVYAPTNTNKRWIIDVYFKDRADWETWSDLGRSYKDDALVVGDEFENWDYYIINADSAMLYGDGVYAGAELTLSHAPTSLYFGYQVGKAANNRNDADGMSGWFFYDGNWMGMEGVNGIGDFGFESDCPECDYTITRIWTATDDCGNASTDVQVITVTPSDETAELVNFDQVLVTKSPKPLINAFPNPTASRSTFEFTIPENAADVTLEVVDLNGKVLSTLYRGSAEAKQQYTFKFDGSNLSPGIYLYRLTTDKATYLEKLMIIR